MLPSPTRLEDLHPDLLTLSLLLLDAPSLAGAAASSSLLRRLSSQPHLWLRLSLSSFPSLHHPLTLPFLSPSPNSFFSDAFPFPAPSPPAGTLIPAAAGTLISAVDISLRGLPIFSRVLATETASPWFNGSPFLIGAIDPKPAPPIPFPAISSPEEMRMSWILIDPLIGRPVNVSSRRPVGIERNCYTGETMLRFAAAPAAEKVIGAVVTCGEGDGRVRDVVLTAEDVDGACVSGEEAVRIVRGMMVARRSGCGEREEETAKRRYEEFVRRKRRRKESRARREGFLDLCCTAIGVVAFLGFMSLMVFR